MWYNSKFFKYTIGAILVLLIVLLLYNIRFLFNPVLDFIIALLFPTIFAGILYYLLRPIVHWLAQRRVLRPLAILGTYIIIVLVLVLVGAYLVPILIKEVREITYIPSEKIEELKEKTVDFFSLFFIKFSLDDLKNAFTTLLWKVNEFISGNIVDAIGTVTKFAIVLAITPFILYYFLKDDDKIREKVIKVCPKKYQEDIKVLLLDADLTLSTFIRGQLMVALIVGFLLFCGYWLIGLNNAVLLAVFAAFFFTIPLLGSFVAFIPALLIALSMGSFMVVKVIIVMLSVLTLEANLISPQIMSARLHIHPLTLMLILLASGLLYGIIGLFLATPIYALAKVIARDLYHFYQKES